MAHWLARQRTVQAASRITRFDPRFWTVDFPRPMMAAVTTLAPDALRVDCTFHTAADLAGLIWWSEDRYDHPLLAYETARDYRRCRLSFRWCSAGLIPLDAANGPTLTIEGRDAGGAPRSWYVRLWNYAEGMPEDAAITLDFSAIDGGFLLPGEADPVWAGDIDRLFVSLVPPGYPGSGALPAPVEGWVELTGITVEGSGGTLAIGDAIVPPHGWRIASGYDDSYNLTPARLLRNALQLGYRGDILHYVGMSHYFRLEVDGDGWFASLAGGVLNRPCAAWHGDFAARAAALGFGVIWSLSLELLDQHCWGDWKQRAIDGSPALTGWQPPSTLLSPAHDGAMAYLRQVAAAFVGIGVAAGLAPAFQLGEPWWWTRPDGRLCIHDDAAQAALGGAADIDLRGPLDAAALALLDRAGTLLAAATRGLIAAAKTAAPGCATHLLIYLPTLLDPAMPELRRANLPLGWAGAVDRLQLEDYDWVTAGATAASRRGAAEAGARLGYPPAQQDYLTGFVLHPEEAGQWTRIEAAGAAAAARGVPRVFAWALPQVIRDGFTRFDLGDDTMQAFDDVLFPLALGQEAEVTPGFATAIVTSAGGHEARTASWAAARTHYDAGPGVRSEDDIAALLAFYRARLGPARGFRFRDPFDWRSGDDAPLPGDQPLGTGDGAAARFALVKHYDEAARRITRPVAGSVRVAIDGVETTGFTLEDGGWIAFDAAPAAGAVLTAGFLFDVPVRFADDALAVTAAHARAGAAASVPLIELREDA